MAAPSLNRCFLHKNPTAFLQQWKSKKRSSSSSSSFLPVRPHRRRPSLRASAGSRADDSLPSEMSLENALRLLGLSDGASFDEIVRAKNSIIASCDGDQQAIAQVEAAYDMLLMQSFTRRMAGKVVSSSIRYADVKPVKKSGTGALPQWLQSAVRSPPVSVEAPSARELGIKAGVYGALTIFTYASGVSTSSTGTYSGAEVPGIILATSFGASLYFLTKKGTGVGKATLITVGGLVVGAIIGSAVEQWLQVDIVPLFGIHSPAVIVSELILISQFLVSLYLRLE
ncbi:protein CHAPERONE-LIKE PROTEIN OF POR1, chloroplastic [Iris pallida]|uniref:Protein CHAPERONE-LIKE PROTEIN OF POR1, chloroplastic n=1 Tax=Iris pallida TaxID=29817 RepID=A0AAX6E0S2_IRIPA|nr:protein CHAPERONE-LIKE PROTEIN OF POR1, chloroplastic [Iris pallida]